MVNFANAAFLFLALAVAPLAWWWLRRPRAAVVFSDLRLLTVGRSARASMSRWGGVALRAAALILIVAALAGPRWPDPSARLVTEGIAIELLVDVSGSMAERDFRWQGQPVSRLDAVKQVLEIFLKGGVGPGGEVFEGRPSDAIGLVTFATWPESRCPLTLSHRALLDALQTEQPRTVPTEQTTNIGDAIAWGLHRLESARSGRRLMILLSDGEHNEPPPALKPRQAAQLAASLGIPIYAIDTGTPVPRPEDLVGVADEVASPTVRAPGRKTLEAVARLTGGRYFAGHDVPTLLGVCEAIDRLERQEVPSHESARYRECYAWLAQLAFATCLGVAVLDRTLWLTAP